MYVILVVNTVIAQVPPATTRTYAKQAEKKEFKRRSMRQQTVLFFPLNENTIGQKSTL